MTLDSQFLAGLLVGDTGSLDCRVGRKVTPHHSLRTLVCSHKMRAAISSKDAEGIAGALRELLPWGRILEARGIIALGLGKGLAFCKMLCDILRTGKEVGGTWGMLFWSDLRIISISGQKAKLFKEIQPCGSLKDKMFLSFIWQSKVNIPDAGCSVPQLFKDIGSFQVFALSSLEELSSAWLKLVIAMSKCTLGRKGTSMEGGCLSPAAWLGSAQGPLDWIMTPNRRVAGNEVWTRAREEFGFW